VNSTRLKGIIPLLLRNDADLIVVLAVKIFKIE
jgi:hypothetical protein